MENEKDKELYSYLSAEYDALRDQLLQDIRQLGDLLRYATVSSGVVWAWILSQKTPPDLPPMVIFIPSIICFLLGVQTWGVRKFVRQASHYLGEQQKKYYPFPNGDKGWEARSPERRKKWPHIGSIEQLIWLILVVTNFAAAVWFNHKH
jgi:hypothetical protein